MDKRYEYGRPEKAIMEKSEIPFGIYQFLDRRVVTIVLSKGFLELFNLNDPEEAYRLMDGDMYRDTHPDDVARIAEDALRFATEGGEYNTVYRSKKNGAYNIIHAFGKHIYPEEGVKLAVVWYVDEGPYNGSDSLDIEGINKDHGRSIYESDIRRKTDYDFLTGIPNMTYFFELARAGRERILSDGGKCVMGYIDFNGMKYYNKRYGYAEGDKILRSFANLLVKYFGSENTCRIAQDNFAFFADEGDVEEAMELLFRDMEFICADRNLTVRIGIYPNEFESVDASVACDRAKQACGAIRDINNSCYRFYDEKMLNYENNHQYILENLDRALSEKWIKAYYQPIVRTANGRVCDEEALARWIDPVRGMLSPGDFIPILEDSKQIYKVDLYIVDEILEKMKTQEKEGLYIVPVSVNLSRTDFDMCDIVEEIRKKMDNAGVSRQMLTIEITESVLGSDFDFMKKQVERFRELGFHVWMDDFGSGYSSLDLLQEIHFDLIKLDMRFMKQFDNSDKSRVIVTEIIKMAVGLDIETVTEGVEKEEQVEFLREVGCTKLQGFYYCKPIPLDEILRRNREGIQIGFENPDESEYYESIGRINLYDMSVTNEDDPEKTSRYFDTMPMAIIEANEEGFRVVRSNRSYRDFLKRNRERMVTEGDYDFVSFEKEADSPIARAVNNCCATGERMYIDENFGNDSTVHAFVRRIAVNPVTGVSACQVVVLGISKDSENSLTYSDVANSLSADYIDLYRVNLDTEEYEEYLPDPTGGGISVEKSGRNFFKQARKDAAIHLYKEDADRFISAFTRENVIKAMDEHGSFTFSYRLVMDGSPVYVSLKALRMSSNDRYMIMGVNNVDAQMKSEEEVERLREERITYARISALAGNYISIYTIDPETDVFTQYGAKEEYRELGLDEFGEDFFEKSRREIEAVIVPEDYDMFMNAFTKENVMREVKESGAFVLDYRLMMNEKPTYIRLKAAMVEEKDGPQLIVGIRNVDEQIRRYNNSDGVFKP